MSTTTDFNLEFRGNPFGDLLSKDRIAALKKADELNSISDNIGNIYIWILCAVGIPGNILTILSILTMQTITPAAVFIALLAFCDGSALVSKLIGHQIFRHEIVIGQTGCQLISFFPICLTTVANWVLVLICFERFISVVYPLKKAFLLTKWRSYMASFFVIISLMAFYAIIIFLMRTSNDAGKECTTKKDYKYFYANVFYWIQASLYLFIPFLCISILTGCIVKSLYNSRRHRRSLVQKNSGSGTGNQGNMANNQRLIAETERLEKMLTTMIVVAAIVFLVFSIPPCVYFLYLDKNSNDVLVQAKWDLFSQIQYLCADATHAINFFLYFLTAKRFRDHLLKMVTCRKCRKITKRRKATNLVDSSLSGSTSKLSHNVHTNSTLA